VLILTESDVRTILSFRHVYEALRRIFLLEDQGLAANTERVRTPFHGSVLTYQAAAAEGFFGFKVFVSGSFMGVLFDREGNAVMLTASDYLTRMRTGALAVLASDLMKGNYQEICVVGLGRQGSFTVKAFNELKGIEPKASARTRSGIERGVENLQSIEARARVVGFSECVKDADVVTTITTSKEPFLKAESLKAGAHVNAMGSNLPERVELFADVIKRASTIAVESVEQAMKEAGDLILAKKLGMLDEGKIVPFSRVVAKKWTRKSDDELTVFKSVGIGLLDLGVMLRLYELAKKYGAGRELPLDLRWSPESAGK
jgi:ornithine cyclodeaminase/alanine dehydrogenase-like protein (mu-crystallin family)